MKLMIATLFAVFAVGCSFAAPLQPSPPPASMPIAGTPARLEVGVLLPDTGQALLRARVFDAYSTALVGTVVTFAASAGLLDSTAVTTDVRGQAETRLTGSGVIAIQVAAGPLVEQRLVTIVATPAPPTPTPMPSPAPMPQPDPLPLTVELRVTAGTAGQITSFSLATQEIASATWTFGDGGTVSTTKPTTSHVYSVAGTYTASVTVIDPRGRSAADSVLFTIRDR